MIEGMNHTKISVVGQPWRWLGRRWKYFREVLGFAYYLKNWRELIVWYLRGTTPPEGSFKFRDGSLVTSRHMQNAIDMFRDIWINKSYLQHGIWLKRGATIIDIGANIGLFTLLAARVATHARIFAFEPEPQNFELLQDNLERSKVQGVTCCNVAISDLHTTRTLHLRKTSADHSLYPQALDPHVRDVVGTVEVECRTLPEVMDQYRLQNCDLLKLDCEGAEFDILSSLPPSYFARISQVVAEYHPKLSRKDPELLRSVLQANCFTVHLSPTPIGGMLYARRHGAEYGVVTRAVRRRQERC